MVCIITIEGKRHRARSRELIDLAIEHFGARLISERHGGSSVLRMTFIGEYALDFVRGLYPEAEIVCGYV